MRFKIFSSGLLGIFVLLLSSCSTYHITTQSLLEQLSNTNKEKKVLFFPFFIPFIVEGNSLRTIKVLDKNEAECIIRVARETSVRITKKDGKKKTFYFDTMIVHDSLITGKNDHFLGISIKPINLNDITKIELQKH
jgi:hypothetical protein